MRAILVILLSVLILPSSSLATVWRVDAHGGADFLTIQAAITAAAGDDEIIVNPATYQENIDYSGKDLWIHSAGGVDQTTINGGGRGSCVTFRNSESLSAILEGFTLTAGTGTSYLGETMGGAIFCLNASPTIRNCSLIGNTANYAAGISVRNADPQITGCTFRGNTSDAYGGGIAGPTSLPVIRDCIFENNDSGSGDGTIHLALASPITGCVFRNNRARSGAAINAGGLGADYQIQGCIFDGNVAWQNGGAIRIHEANGLIERCLFVGNSATANGGAIIALDGAAPTIRNCTFDHNGAGETGGGISVWAYAQPAISNCIIADTDAGAGIYCVYGSPILLCNDVWHSAGGNYGGDCGDPTGQNGNISEDPLFCNPASGDYGIRSDSPCAPAHNPACGLIGAYDIACGGPTPVRPVSWGMLKGMYR